MLLGTLVLSSWVWRRLRRALHFQRSAILCLLHASRILLCICEVRAFGQTALDTLLKAGASTSGSPPARDISKEVVDIVAVLLTLLPTDLINPSSTEPNGSPSARHPLVNQSLQFQGSMVADLVYNRRFRDTEVWKRCIGVYMTSWLGEEGSATFAESARAHFYAVDQVCSACDETSNH